MVIYFTFVIGIGFALRRLITDLDRLLPLRALAAGLDHRDRLHLGEPRGDRDPRHVRQRRPVRHQHRALLLDRRRAGDGVPRHRDDAVLLRLAGPERPRVPAAPLRPEDAPGQRHHLRPVLGAHRGREPVRAVRRAGGPARDPAGRRHRGVGAVRAVLHPAGRAVERHLQRGHAVLRHLRGPGPRGHRRAEGDRRHRRPVRQAQHERPRLHLRLVRRRARRPQPDR